MRGSKLVALVAVLALGAISPKARAQDPARAADAGPALAPLLARLATHAAHFEEMKRRGAFTLNGRMEELDGGGRASGTKEIVLRVEPTPVKRRTEILRYLEDGADKTAEAREKARKRRAEKRKQRDYHLPFLASEQGRYTFALLERNASHVRVGFTPKAPAEDAFKGSAWVDEGSGEVLTIGFSPTKNPTFVDHVDVTMRFDLSTPLGRAPSRIDFDARGGFLVVRKHYRGSATITDARIHPAASGWVSEQ